MFELQFACVLTYNRIWGQVLSSGLDYGGDDSYGFVVNLIEQLKTNIFDFVCKLVFDRGWLPLVDHVTSVFYTLYLRLIGCDVGSKFFGGDTVVLNEFSEVVLPRLIHYHFDFRHVVAIGWFFIADLHVDVFHSCQWVRII